MYLYDTHVHTSNGSLCAQSTPEEMAQYYAEGGYSGIFITEHFIHGNTAVPKDWEWERRIDRYYQSVERARAAVRGTQLEIFFGIEHHYGYGKEVLVYQITPEYLTRFPEIPQLDIDSFAQLMHEGGAFLSHAHPYRQRYYIDPSFAPRLDLCDGIEVINVCNDPQANLQAFDALQQRPALIPLCGSDRHATGDPAVFAQQCGGVALEQPVHSDSDFFAACREGQAHLYYHRTVVDSKQAYCDALAREEKDNA